MAQGYICYILSRIPRGKSLPIQGCLGVKENKGVTLRHNNHGVSVQEISVASQSSSSRDTRQLEETEEEECWAYTCTVKAVQMGDFPINLLLETSQNLLSASKPFPQDADDSGLSSAAHLVLWNFITGKVCQDWAPEDLLAAHILASNTSWCSIKTEPSTTKSPFQDRSPFLPHEL